jgi:arylsulfatase
MMDHIDDWGSPNTFPHFAIGWAHAGNTPFHGPNKLHHHFGGTRNGMVVHWPKGIKSKGEVRSQFTHVTDIAPTVLEAAGLPFPKSVNGTAQIPFSRHLFSSIHSTTRKRRIPILRSILKCSATGVFTIMAGWHVPAIPFPG